MAIIGAAYFENGENKRLLGDIVKRIKKRIEELEAHYEFYDLRPLNGEYHLTFKGARQQKPASLVMFL